MQPCPNHTKLILLFCGQGFSTLKLSFFAFGHPNWVDLLERLSAEAGRNTFNMIDENRTWNNQKGRTQKKLIFSLNSVENF